MKSIKFFFACVLALTFVACSNAESDSFEDNSSSFESMISLYGIQTATTDLASLASTHPLSKKYTVLFLPRIVYASR